VAALVATAVAACSSSSSSTSTTTSSSASSTSSGATTASTIKLGVLTSLSGPAAAGFAGTEVGVKARLGQQNAQGGVNGHKLSYVMLDDASSPTGTATAVTKAVEQEHVFALLDVSAFFFGGYQAAAKASLPVVGVSFDGGPEWIAHSTYPTFFDIDGGVNYTKAATTYALAAKMLGVTKLGSMGGIGNPSATEAAQGAIDAGATLGIAKGFYSAISIGSTDVGPFVIGVKNSHTDGLYLPTQPNTAFAVIAGLAQAGVKMKMIALATGYGGDLLASSQAVAAGQGAYFSTVASPVEANTPATQAFQAALKTYAGYTGVPTFSQYQGWLAADAFIYGLQHAGTNPAQASFVTFMNSGGSTWNGGGLLPRTVNFSAPGSVGAGLGPGNCVYLPQLKASKFILKPGLDPICGSIVPGLTLTP
jgi:branched-chain amino acid transport system substrate-binding protein